MVRPCLAPGPRQPPPPAHGHGRPGAKGPARAPWLVGACECAVVRVPGIGCTVGAGLCVAPGMACVVGVCAHFPDQQGEGPSCVWPGAVCAPAGGLLPSACSFLLFLPDVRSFPRLGLVSRAQSPAGSQACHVAPRPARRTGSEVGTVQTSTGVPAAVQARRTDSGPCSVPTGLTGDTGFPHGASISSSCQPHAASQEAPLWYLLYIGPEPQYPILAGGAESLGGEATFLGRAWTCCGVGQPCCPADPWRKEAPKPPAPLCHRCSLSGRGSPLLASRPWWSFHVPSIACPEGSWEAGLGAPSVELCSPLHPPTTPIPKSLTKIVTSR